MRMINTARAGHAENSALLCRIIMLGGAYPCAGSWSTRSWSSGVGSFLVARISPNICSWR